MIARKYTFNNFAIGRANQLAYLSVKRTLKNRGVDINPLFIYSKKGLGKTHLVSSVKEILKDEDVLCLDCAELKSIPKTAGSVFILENLHLLPDEVKKGMDLYTFINSFITAKKQVYITSLLPPEELGISEQLVSLIKKGLTVPIFKPDPELASRIFKMISSDFGMELKDDVIHFLSGLPFYDIREIETVLKKIDLLKDVTKEITVENVKDNIALEEIVPPDRRLAPFPGEDKEFFDFVKDLKEDFDKGATEQKDTMAIKNEYMLKLYIWKMKGFNVRRLEEAMDGPIDGIIQAFVSFTSGIQRLIELQKIFGELEKTTTLEEREYLEKNLFDPDAIFDIERTLKKVEERRKLKGEYNKFLSGRSTTENFVILHSNREVYEVLKKGLSKKQDVNSPIYIYGDDGCGKTHLLIAFTKKMQSLYPEKIITYIPSNFLTIEIKNLFDEDARNMYIEKLKGIDTILLDDIENVVNDGESKSLFVVVLDNFKEEKKLLVVSSKLPPEELDLEDNYKELLLSGTVVPIKQLDEEDKRVIITSLFTCKRISLPDEIKEFLSKNLFGKFIDIKRSVANIIKKVIDENIELTMENISACIGIEKLVLEKQKKLRKKEKPKVPSTTEEKILLSELDQRWPYLNERIFEDYNLE